MESEAVGARWPRLNTVCWLRQGWWANFWKPWSSCTRMTKSGGCSAAQQPLEASYWAGTSGAGRGLTAPLPHEAVMSVALQCKALWRRAGHWSRTCPNFCDVVGGVGQARTRALLLTYGDISAGQFMQEQQELLISSIALKHWQAEGLWCWPWRCQLRLTAGLPCDLPWCALLLLVASYIQCRFHLCGGRDCRDCSKSLLQG
jgi:hypothetical protein